MAKARYKIEQPDWGTEKELFILNWKQLQKIVPSVEICTRYDKFRIKDGVLFGSIEMSGDRMDGWARHFYYIAIDTKTKEILSVLKKVHGWHGSFTYCSEPFNGTVFEWRKLQIRKVNEK